jgi:N-ethylmaleimide reductase
MEPTEADLKTGAVQIEHTTAALRPAFPGVMISNGGYDKAKAEAALAAGTADLVSFGVPFLVNPDLPARFQGDAPLNTPDPATF